jgi:AcrR family transcriptional regulator
MDVAEKHLGGSGYLGVSLEEVVKEVGGSKPALYYHFPEGKEGWIP